MKKILFFLLTLSSCATVIHGPNQKLRIDCNKPRASVIVDDRYMGQVKDKIKLRRVGHFKDQRADKKHYHVKVEYPGCKTQSFVLERKTSPWVWLNITNLSLMYYVVDQSTESAYRLMPKEIVVNFEEPVLLKTQ